MRKRRVSLAVWVLAAGAIVASPAAAQIQTGSLLVRALDEQGAVVPGVTVTISSVVLPRPLEGVTDSSGIYRAPGLGVGRYTVKTSLQGFQTIIREGVIVTQAQTTSVDLTMKVSTLAEEVTVKAESPVIDAKSANVNINLDKSLLETTPGGKDIWNILEYKVPGLVFDTPDVGGNQAGLQRSFTARGTPNAQNVQLLNGVNVGDPAAIGFSMNYYDPSSFDNIQVSSGAQDISMGTSGVVINMVTKSGTNRLTGMALQTYQGNATQTDNIDAELKAAGFRPDANATELLTNTNVQAGGPLLKNKMFYFGSMNFQPIHVSVPGFPAVSTLPVQLADTSTQDTTDILTGTGKLTYQLGGSHKFDAYFSKQRYDKPNRGAGTGVTQDSTSKEYDIDNVVQGLWNWIVTDRVFAQTNVSYNNVHFPLNQKTELQPLQDTAAGVQLRNDTSTAIMFRRRLEIASTWQYLVPQFLSGRHEIRGGFNNSYTPEDVTTERIENVNLTFRSFATSATQPAGPVQVTIFNSPIFVKRAVVNTAAYVQDSYSVGRLTAIAGIRWERVEGYLPEQVHPSSSYFPSGTVINGLNVALNTGGTVTQYVVPDTFAEVRNAPLWKNWAPRFSSTYDLSGRGTTVLKFSIGKYLDQIGTGTPGPNPNGTVSQRYTWNDTNSDLVFQRGNAVWDGFKYVGGEFGALANNGTTIPNPNPFDTLRRRTYRNELTAGVDHELFAGVRLSSTYIYRTEKDPYGPVDVDMNLWPTVYAPVPVIDPGIDGVTGTGDDNTVTAFNIRPDVTAVQRNVNDDRLGVRYHGLETTVTKRYSAGFVLTGGYTFAHQKVDQLSLANPNVLINSQGESGGRRHLFKMSGSYMFPHEILFGANFRMQSGLPTTRTFTVQACTTTVTSNCLTPPPGSNNTTILAEPRGSTMLDGLYTIDLRAGRSFRFGSNRVELSVDAYNVTNANTIYSVRTGSSLTNIRVNGDPNQPITQIPTYLSPTGVLGPRIYRFNVTYWFGGN